MWGRPRQPFIYWVMSKSGSQCYRLSQGDISVGHGHLLLSLTLEQKWKQSRCTDGQGINTAVAVFPFLQIDIALETRACKADRFMWLPTGSWE